MATPLGVRGHIIDCSDGDVARDWSKELEIDNGGVYEFVSQDFQVSRRDFQAVM